ncbi:MAG: hypothetical protein ACI4S9_07395 [Christensenellales bacterium]
MRVRKLFVSIMVLVFAATAFVGCGGGGDSDNTLTIFRWDFAAVDSARKQNTAIYREITENTGASIKISTASSAGWEEVLNKNFNTNQLPDIFVSYAMDRPTNYRKWIEDGAILPVSDYVTEESYPNLYARLKKYDYLAERLSYAGGKHYAFPIEISLEHGMFIRLDWIDNLNKKLASILVTEGIISKESDMTPEIYEANKFVVPKTLVEFYKLTRAFSRYDPDGNGRNDTYGYTCSETNMWFNNWIFEAMSSADVHDSTFWGIVEDGKGKLTASWVTEGNKKAVAFLNKLYNENILDPDYIDTDSNAKITNFVQGKVGIMVGNIWYNTMLQKFMDANSMTMDEAKESFAVIAPPAGEQGVYGMRGNPGFWCCVSINGRLSASKRKLALDFLEYIYSPEADELFTYGVEGVHYEVVDGEKVSKMGKDSSGYNYSLESYDPAFALSSLSKWTYSYYNPYQTNADTIRTLMDNAAAYTKTDPVMYVQTPLYVEKDYVIANSALESFVNMIKNKSYYDASTAGFNVNWADLYKYTAAYNQAWSAYTNDYLVTWGGQEMLDEFNLEAVKYLK